MTDTKIQGITDTARRLSGIPAPFGREEELSRYIGTYLGELGYDVRTDAMGSVTVTLNKSGNHALLTGIDTQAYYVTSVDPDGTVHVGSMPSAKFTAPIPVIGTGGIEGLLSAEDTVDIGATDAESAQARVKVGDAFTPAAGFSSTRERMSGACLSRRAMAALLMDILSEKPSGITASHIVFTAQELALRGTLCALNAISPRIAINLTATDSAKCGDGALVIIKDKSTVSNIELARALSAIAEREGIRSTPVATDRSSGIQNVMTYAGGGARVCTVGVACEGMGTEHESIHISDLAEARRLVYELLTRNF